MPKGLITLGLLGKSSDGWPRNPSLKQNLPSFSSAVWPLCGCYFCTIAYFSLHPLTSNFKPIHPHLVFTLEEEVNGKLPFLDVLVEWSNVAQHTTVYTKPTATDRFLDFTSPSPQNHKFAMACSLLSRAKAIFYPDSDTKTVHQLVRWRNILILKNYPPNFLNKW